MPRYTASQAARLAWLTGRIAKQAAADDELSEQTCVDPKFQREIDRIKARAHEEESYQTYAARRQLDEALRAAARAKTRLDAAAPGRDKAQARRARNDAEAALKRAQRAARRAGI
ncbi:hypothetical protein DEJ49_33230 [Streptomyces venezuelae]|uniref:Uncharacterized protein n=1 Tax=Streptomyces venezuelae TaxID=54571 RepID=A0A5P2CQL8_STRVZ|nr:hypothetical protein [Streptomyces venezuelae]QES45204.1 hypothetical protein DEJ49_33230 [Streptomyces venezuelae]